jgi:hypothetical protein
MTGSSKCRSKFVISFISYSGLGRIVSYCLTPKRKMRFASSYTGLDFGTKTPPFSYCRTASFLYRLAKNRPGRKIFIIL